VGQIAAIGILKTIKSTEGNCKRGLKVREGEGSATHGHKKGMKEGRGCLEKSRRPQGFSLTEGEGGVGEYFGGGGGRVW